MNLLYAVSWYYSATETEPRAFYNKLRRCVAQGKRFPFNCPYEVALVKVLPRPDSYWLVAVLALRNTPGDDSVETVDRLRDWFKACDAGGWEDNESRRALSLSVDSELGDGYDVVDHFGTFVGEPEPETAPAEEPQLPVLPTSPDLEVIEPPRAVPAVPAAPPEPLIQSQPVIPPVPAPLLPQALSTSIPVPPQPSIRPASTPSAGSGGASSCFGIGLTVLGVLTLLGGLGTAGILLLGQSTGETGVSAEDLLLTLACIPLPVLLAGALLLAIGVLLLRRSRKAA